MRCVGLLHKQDKCRANTPRWRRSRGWRQVLCPERQLPNRPKHLSDSAGAIQGKGKVLPLCLQLNKPDTKHTYTKKFVQWKVPGSLE